jgi:hypothetical protein
MSRTIGLDRVYPLGEYKNIRVSDTFTIPEEVMLDDNYINTIVKMLMCTIEVTYLKYIKMSNKLASLSLDEQVQLLEEVKSQTMEELHKLKTTKMEEV